MKKIILSVELKKLKSETTNELEKYVLDDIIEYGQIEPELENYLKDVLNHGCQSGICSGLIYYKDTNNFYDKFEGEIWDIVNNISEEMEESTFQMIDGLNGSKNVGSNEQFKNLLAWFAYEETCRKIADKLEIEI